MWLGAGPCGVQSPPLHVTGASPPSAGLGCLPCLLPIAGSGSVDRGRLYWAGGGALCCHPTTSPAWTHTLSFASTLSNNIHFKENGFSLVFFCFIVFSIILYPRTVSYSRNNEDVTLSTTTHSVNVFSMQSADATSNWDFTEVINLLRTPTKPPVSLEDASIKTDRRNGFVANADCSLDHTRLGDFSALWDALRQPAVIRNPSEIDETARHSLKEASTATSHNPTSTSPSKPIAILKRPTKVESLHQPTRLNNDTSLGILSDSTAEAISDGDASVFDSPVTRKSALAFVPSQIHAIEETTPILTPPSSCEEETTPLKTYDKVTEKTARYKSAADRKAGLVLKLGKNFPESKGLSPPTQLKTHGLHVFVDSSNISIGLHDSYKIQHGIPVTTHIRRLPLSFHNLSLILERGRPVAKRVLAGSDRFAAIKEAEKIGYEVNILSRVHKAKEFTPRQLKFRNAPNHGGVVNSETGSSPPERWVEQCVDEILHLKMLESLVDTDKPATIVLATGDAAEAEFSEGFLRMVERALQKGWKVEVVSFAMNTSFAYKRKEFRAKWKSQFRMINLEDYVEEMLDM